MLPIRQTLRLTQGTVVLRAWPATVADAHLTDLLTLTLTLGSIREEWGNFQADDLDAGVWAAFWKLARLSLEPGSLLPPSLSWHDRLVVLTAMWDLNDLEEAEGKAAALSQRATTLLEKTRGLTTRPSRPSPSPSPNMIPDLTTPPWTS